MSEAQKLDWLVDAALNANILWLQQVLIMPGAETVTGLATTYTHLSQHAPIEAVANGPLHAMRGALRCFGVRVVARDTASSHGRPPLFGRPTSDASDAFVAHDLAQRHGFDQRGRHDLVQRGQRLLPAARRPLLRRRPLLASGLSPEGSCVHARIRIHLFALCCCVCVLRVFVYTC